MSLSTWKKEFYPITAIEAAKQGPRAALEHSIKKWEGGAVANCKKHGISIGKGIGKGIIYDFSFDGESCALCKLFLGDPCEGCPLYIALGHNVCDDPRQPYSTFIHTGSVRSMLAALRKARRLFTDPKRRKKLTAEERKALGL